jgi:hypothetical protein
LTVTTSLAPLLRETSIVADLTCLAAADMYPSAKVVGIDLSPIQPTWLPVNARMYVEDYEERDWLHGSGFDLVHFRGIADTARDLDGLLAKIFPYVLYFFGVEISFD